MTNLGPPVAGSGDGVGELGPRSEAGQALLESAFQLPARV